MPLAPPNPLVEALRGRPILGPERFAELESVHAPAHPDPQALARHLIQLGWLTVYQAKKVVSGRAGELVVGPYVILDKLGEGGMGRVFKAVQLSLNRLVALKVVRAQLLSSRIALKRFRREVKAAAGLRHPNIVSVFDADRIGDRHFLAMEYIEGVDLARLLRDRGPLPISVACSYIRQAALGLQHAHERGIIHRDIKPANLLVSVDGSGQFTSRNAVKILDMGLARRDGLNAEKASNSTDLTRIGTVIGTPDYMSPEQARDSSAVDHRSDLYSLGCTFYHALTGEAPFPKGAAVEKLLQHQSDPPRPVQSLRPDVPPELATVVHCLLAKNSKERFQSGGALAHALEPWSTAGGQSGYNPRPVPRAEAVDPSSASIETDPNDPFNFDSASTAATPVATHRSPAQSGRAGRPTKALYWVALVALFTGFFLVGAVGAALLFGGRSNAPDPASPGSPVPAKSNPGKPAPKPES
ncbi:MAG TPA: serine/threonine-protein kinase [Gemmataceae bacterium]|nr:serine/threonine-protein kinase [Gemmataceae bacterium]